MPQDPPQSHIRSSFQARLFLVFTLLTALIAVLLCTLYIITEVKEQRHYARQEIRLLARHLADTLRLPLYAEDREALQAVVGQALLFPQIKRAVVRSSDGRILAEAHSPDVSPSDEKLVETVEVRTMPLVPSDLSSAGGADPNAPSVLVGTIRLERGSADLEDAVFRNALIAISAAVGFWLAVLGICHLVLRKVIFSFNALMRGIEQMQEGDYHSRIDVVSDDEPARAAHAINALAESLFLREEENRRLTNELLDAMRMEVQQKQNLADTNRILQVEVEERVKAEQGLRESEQALRSLMDFMPVGVAWVSLEGEIQYLNNFFMERFGYCLDDIRTTDDWFRLAYPDPLYRQERLAIYRKARAILDETPTNEPQLYETRVVCKNGTVRHVLFKLQSTHNRIIMVMVDITDRELMQEKLITSKKLESLAVLAGGVAHNFNNVLTGIMGYITYARKSLDETNPIYPILQSAETASKRAAAMANQLLTFARGTATAHKAVSVSKIIDECISLYLIQKEVQCHVDIPADLYAVKGDEDQLGQVFSNIILNALQAMRDRGELHIRAENVTKPGSQFGNPGYEDYVRLTFRDNGPGIRPEDLDRIFDPYFTTKPTGTGLGLASVHSIVKKHGGDIQVQSSEGQGAVFIITLPATFVKEAPEESIPATFAAPEGEKILIMDDEEAISGMAKENLEFLGYRVESCDNGDDAVKLYKAAYEAGTPYMAAILDLTVTKGMGGTEAASQILAFHADAKLVVSSGYSYNPVMVRYRDYGFSAAVTKPYRAEELSRELGRLRRA